jgi:hypothetical protein
MDAALASRLARLAARRGVEVKVTASGVKAYGRQAPRCRRGSSRLLAEAVQIASLIFSVMKRRSSAFCA